VEGARREAFPSGALGRFSGSRYNGRDFRLTDVYGQVVRALIA
jgi:hypothetical protein